MGVKRFLALALGLCVSGSAAIAQTKPADGPNQPEATPAAPAATPAAPAKPAATPAAATPAKPAKPAAATPPAAKPDPAPPADVIAKPGADTGAGKPDKPPFPAEQRLTPYDAQLPICTDEYALGVILKQFARREVDYWDSKLELQQFENIKEIAFRPWGKSFVPRRFCQGQVLASDGKRYPVWFSIIEDASIVSWTYGVEWCVEGLDRSLRYAPKCQAAKP